jgi:hypothetical protein
MFIKNEFMSGSRFEYEGMYSFILFGRNRRSISDSSYRLSYVISLNAVLAESGLCYTI